MHVPMAAAERRGTIGGLLVNIANPNKNVSPMNQRPSAQRNRNSKAAGGKLSLFGHNK